MAAPAPAPDSSAAPAAAPLMDRWFDAWMARFGAPPQWLQQELLRRAVLALNHVIMAEPAAQARLLRQQGKVLKLNWRDLGVGFAITPAGLFELQDAGAAAPAADLNLALLQTSPTELVHGALRGDKPGLRIEGDIQLAAEINWLADHLRWDAEQDLSRLVGDAAAHTLVQGARQLLARLREWLPKAAPLQS